LLPVLLGGVGLILMRLPLKSLELVGVIGASRTLKSIFLNNKNAKNLKTIVAYTKSTDLIFKTFKKNYSFRDDTVPLTSFL
jgi:hypothetical protein